MTWWRSCCFRTCSTFLTSAVIDLCRGDAGRVSPSGRQPQELASQALALTQPAQQLLRHSSSLKRQSSSVAETDGEQPRAWLPTQTDSQWACSSDSFHVSTISPALCCVANECEQQTRLWL